MTASRDDVKAMRDEIERLRADLQSAATYADARRCEIQDNERQIERLRADNAQLRQLLKTLTEADPRHDLPAEIERLRAALREIISDGGVERDNDGVSRNDMIKIARRALEPKP